jgi:hypothetical protein
MMPLKNSKSTKRMAFRQFVLAVLAASAFSAMGADSAPSNEVNSASITPYRPSVSSPAQLPAVGQLEMEVGGLRQRSNGARRDSLPVQLKLAFSPEWGVLLGGEAHVAIHDGATSERGAGDTTVVLKRAWAIDDATGLGLELGVKIATAKDSIGSGKTDTALNAIYSKDLGPVHMDANLNFTRLGGVDVDTGRIQTGLSASFSTPLNAQWGVTGEVSGTRRSGADSSAQILGALSYSPSKRLTFDFGAARAAKPSPGSTSVFMGVVFPVTNLW